ncbi:FadR/GntR family transcriptional regulator [Arthrobacter sp. FX8]|jgi:DNA-binding FadR family transcriptional regulator|uniref:FadR/GntR family transcriptional regulator n=1 Tax=Micrococcaceae TaxID=1268 RepID=UPI00036AA56F|nr:MULTISPECIES: FadR/GntR family transcriptional regulator [unclassified Arthrobacter]KRE76181.1 GntR family transcriptional regulator [Arthrobacter sp. Soil761]TWD48438.1 GntR family transcriptional regulator [Arthrobacter sp. AG367]WAJ33631.1 FadR/GntR family transcriptional regulator [Arthrobacter sp. FX8]BCW53436.1 GntR family transcriptional regulator [Arthrobacter sp. StoSoilB19]BCW74521.1 GntR family transcriptional regulator [Arthrobacter sp. NicSoilB11]
MAEKRPTLVDAVVDKVLEHILSGEIKADDALPPEADIAKESGVSRLTAREAMKVLKAQDVVYVRRGLGTFVNPPERWTGLDAIMRAASRGVASDQVALRLLEVRRMVETGAAELAASRHRPADLAALQDSVEQMEAAHHAGDVDALTVADIAFHDTVLRASGNPFVPALLGQLSTLLYAMRRETSAFPDVQRHAIHHHKMVLAAIAAGDPATARSTMDAHITQTFEDYEHYLAVSSRSGAAAR